jgi:hypothetical protein
VKFGALDIDAGAPAAVKVIRPPSSGNGRFRIPDDAAQRFEREAQVIAKPAPPHNGRRLDFGVADDGAFTTPWSPGRARRRHAVRRFGPLPADWTIHPPPDLPLPSEAESHEPSTRHQTMNIFLCRYGEDCDFVKVLDFGW